MNSFLTKNFDEFGSKQYRWYISMEVVALSITFFKINAELF